VGATAGLRLLPGSKADDILSAVKQHLTKDYPFQLEQVSIIDGAQCHSQTNRKVCQCAMRLVC